MLLLKYSFRELLNCLPCRDDAHMGGQLLRARLPALTLAAALYVVAAALVPGPESSSAALPEGTVEFQDGASSAKQSFTTGEVAVLYVRDASLAIVATSTATWTTIGALVEAGTWWSLATGAPEPAVYALSPGSFCTTRPLRPTPL